MFQPEPTLTGTSSRATASISSVAGRSFIFNRLSFFIFCTASLFHKINVIPYSGLDFFSIYFDNSNLTDYFGFTPLSGKCENIAQFSTRSGCLASNDGIAAAADAVLTLYLAAYLAAWVIHHVGKRMEKEFFPRQPPQDRQLCAGNFGVTIVLVNIPAGCTKQ